MSAHPSLLLTTALFTTVMLAALSPGAATAHCDGLDGPVVAAARTALERGNVNLVLPWVRPGDEPEIRSAFDHARAVRRLGPEAKTLADTHFFETLVRVHRAGEGAPYTGLKPAGRDLGPAIPAGDKALATGSIETTEKLLLDGVRKGLHEQFHDAVSRKKFDENDVTAGRRYVEAYVSYIHYVERLWEAATKGAGGHYAEPAAETDAHKH